MKELPLNLHQLELLNYFLTEHSHLSLIGFDGFLAGISSSVIALPIEICLMTICPAAQFSAPARQKTILELSKLYYLSLNSRLQQRDYQPLLDLHQLTSLETLNKQLNAAADWATSYLDGLRFSPPSSFNRNIFKLLAPLVALSGKAENTNYLYQKSWAYIDPNASSEAILKSILTLPQQIYLKMKNID